MSDTTGFYAATDAEYEIAKDALQAAYEALAAANAEILRVAPERTIAEIAMACDEDEDAFYMQEWIVETNDGHEAIAYVVLLGHSDIDGASLYKVWGYSFSCDEVLLGVFRADYPAYRIG